uniref:RNA-directed DNA polymerase n=2 Tax=Strongyloides stercoralis TaxID=6248 RepID=A0A0K0EAY5_STRER
MGERGGSIVQGVGEFCPAKEKVEDWLERLDVALDMGCISEARLRRLILIRDLGAKAFSEVKAKLAPRLLKDVEEKEIRKIMVEIYSNEKTSPTVSLLELLNMRQGEESLREFGLLIRRSARECSLEEWGKGKEQFLSLIFLNGLKDEIVKRVLMASKELNLDKLIEIGRSHEIVHQKGTVVAYVKNERKSQFKCMCCGRNGHTKERCRLKDRECHGCGRKGHLKNMCKNGNKKGTMGNVDVEYDSESEEEMYHLDEISTGKNKNLSGLVRVSIMDQNIMFKLDTGADKSIISKNVWEQLGKPALVTKNINENLFDVNGQKLEILGYLRCKISIKNVEYPAELRVFERNKCLIGKDLIMAVKLDLNSLFYEMDDITKGEGFSASDQTQVFIQKYPRLFDTQRNDGSKLTAKLILKKDHIPKFVPPRRHPYALRDKVNEELRRMIAMNVIKPVPTSKWSSPICAVLKPDGSVRICGDYSKTVNPQLDIEQFPIPSLYEALDKVSNCSIYGKIDLKNAFNQLHMDKEGAEILSLSTPLGLMSVLRLQPGVASAPAIFQNAMYSRLSLVSNCSCYFDDIIVGSDSKLNLVKKLDEVLGILDNMGLVVNPKELELFKSEVLFLGHIISSQGRRPSPEKIQGILCLKTPKNAAEVHTFIGKCLHYADYIKNASLKARPLYNLIRKGTKFIWSEVENKAFLELKKDLETITTLTLFDEKKIVVLACDASEFGLGSVLLLRDPVTKKERPFAHASRTFSGSQRNWSQLDKEAAGIIFGVTKFQDFLLGRQFVLQTDSKPLTYLFGDKAGLPITALKRVDRWSIILQRFTYSIEYVKTGEFSKVDCLSRLPSSEILPDDVEVLEVEDAMLNNVPLDLGRIREAQSNDKIISIVSQLVLTTFPEYIKDAEIKEFKKYQFELSVIKGVLFRNNCVVIPEKLKNEVLKLLHQGHFGSSKIKMLARSYVFWPGYTNDIEVMVKGCRTCQEFGDPKTNEGLHSWEKAPSPWFRIHMDFAGPFMGSMWLLIVCAMSKFPHVYRMSKTESVNIIYCLKELFALHGNPVQLVTDNGRNFTSREMSRFLASRKIVHIRTPAFHPMSNGQCERFVKTFKQSMNKLTESYSIEESVQIFLQQFRITPNKFNKISPSEAMFRRQIRTTLNCLLEEPADDIVNKKFTVLYDQGEEVYTRNYKASSKKVWEPAIIDSQHAPNLYFVKTETVPKKLVHTSQLKSSGEPAKGLKKWDQPGLSFSRSYNSRVTRNPQPKYK